MNKASALKILGLPPGATRDGAKKRFRELAKSFHPDRFGTDARGAEAAEVRMKEINAAFQFLVPLLPAGPVPDLNPGEGSKIKPDKGTTPEKDRMPRQSKGPGFFSSLRRHWRRKRPAAGTASRFRTAQSRTKASGSGTNRRSASQPRGFDSLLTAMVPGPRPCPGKRHGKPVRPYDNYCRYMAVKKGIRRARQRSSQTGIGRVEKIRPVRPVEPLGGN